MRTPPYLRRKPKAESVPLIVTTRHIAYMDEYLCGSEDEPFEAEEHVPDNARVASIVCETCHTKVIKVLQKYEVMLTQINEITMERVVD